MNNVKLFKKQINNLPVFSGLARSNPASFTRDTGFLWIYQNMKTKSYHVSNLGSYAPPGATQNGQGYITYHDSPRYAKATEEQLAEWSASRNQAVRNAALTEIAERALAVWQSAKS